MADLASTSEQKPARGPEHVHINQLEKSITPFLPSNGWLIKMRMPKYIGLLTMWANEKVLNTVQVEKR